MKTVGTWSHDVSGADTSKELNAWDMGARSMVFSPYGFGSGGVSIKVQDTDGGHSRLVAGCQGASVEADNIAPLILPIELPVVRFEYSVAQMFKVWFYDEYQPASGVAAFQKFGQNVAAGSTTVMKTRISLGRFVSVFMWALSSRAAHITMYGRIQGFDLAPVTVMTLVANVPQFVPTSGFMAAPPCATFAVVNDDGANAANIDWILFGVLG